LPKPFLSTVKGKLDTDLRANLKSKWLPPLKAALRHLRMSEEEEKSFIIDIQKYAETISPQELREIPRDKVLPFLLNAIWKYQVREAQTESEEFEEGNEDEEENEGSETDKDAQDLAGADQLDKPLSPELSKRGQRYKLLLDKVAPFYIEERTEAEKIDVDIASQKNLSRALWRYVMDNMEPEYPLPTLILKKHQYLKREEPRNLGPGCYDPNFIECVRRRKLGLTRGQMSSCKPRFGREYVKMDSPDPGAYGNPYDNLKKACPCGKVTLLQSGPCDIRGKTFKTTGSSLAPGDYEVTSSIEELLKKRTSSRGPYDLFSQPNRFDILHGYFKVPKLNLEPGMYGIHGSLKDLLNSRCNHLKGKLSKMSRDQRSTGERISISNPMWPSSDAAKFPGPGHYDIQKPEYKRTCWGENYWAFNISTRARPDLPSDVDNAPTRYRPELADRKYCATGCGFRSNFRSKTTRLDFNKNNVLSERLRGKDLPPKEKARFVDECRSFL
jgi:hypothetical protein